MCSVGVSIGWMVRLVILWSGRLKCLCIKVNFFLLMHVR